MLRPYACPAPAARATRLAKLHRWAVPVVGLVCLLATRAAGDDSDRRRMTEGQGLAMNTNPPLTEVRSGMLQPNSILPSQ